MAAEKLITNRQQELEADEDEVGGTACPSFAASLFLAGCLSEVVNEGVKEVLGVLHQPLCPRLELTTKVLNKGRCTL